MEINTVNKSVLVIQFVRGKITVLNTIGYQIVPDRCVMFYNGLCKL